MINNRWQKEVLSFLPKQLSCAIKTLNEYQQNTIEEIRIRSQKPLQVIGKDWTRFFNKAGPSKLQDATIICSSEQCAETMGQISFHSVYALQNQIKNGYITLPGGHRVGVCGRGVVENGEIARITDVMCFNFRIARNVQGCSKSVLPLLQNDDTIYSTLVVSPPNCGKTTFLRDVARQIATGQFGLNHKVCIADERGEIAGATSGVCQNDVGVLSDVFSQCPKAQAIEVLLRSMSPSVIVTDEIGDFNDSQALINCANAGVSVVASAHAKNIDELLRRPVLKQICENKIFERYIVLSRKNGPGTIDVVFDADFNKIVM